MSILEGPRADAASGTKDSLVILLHGYGADGNDLFGLAQALGPHLPNTAFRSPNAPEPCAVNPGGYQWFPISWLDGSPESAMKDGARRAVGTLNAYFDEVLAEEALPADKVVVVGFSQGTMMTLTVALRRAEAFAGVVGFSGRYIAEAEDGPITARPPVLLIHGDQDEMVPIASLGEAEAALKAESVPVITHVSKGTGHGIAPDGLSLALGFIKQALAGGPGAA